MSIPRSASFYNKEDNLILVFDSVHSPGILIESADGIYSFEADVSTSPYSQTHGSKYKTTRVPQRNIVINGKIFVDKDTPSFHDNRQLIYKVFRPGSKGVFTYYETNEENRLADYYVESVTIDQEWHLGDFQISLICPDPFFYGTEDITVNLASWTSGWTFPHNFIASGEPMGERSATMIKELQNKNGVSGIGLKITMSCTGDVLNPYIYMYETGERITIGTEDMPFTLSSGQVITIDTTTGEKSITMTQQGIEASVIAYLDPASAFFQLDAGINTIGYNAESGAENLMVKVQYRMRYLGV